MKPYIAAFAFFAFVCASKSQAATTLYWDVDLTGVLGGSGTWQDATTTWTSQYGGGGSASAWNNASLYQAFFSGSSGNVAVSGGVSVNGLTFDRSGYVLTGGDITIVQPANYTISLMIDGYITSGATTISNNIIFAANDATANWRYRVTNYAKVGSILTLNGNISLTNTNAGASALSGYRSIDFDVINDATTRIVLNGAVGGGQGTSTLAVRFGENSSIGGIYEMNGTSSGLTSTDQISVVRGTLLVGNAAALGNATIYVGNGGTQAGQTAAILTNGAVTITNSMITGNSGSTSGTYVYGGNTADTSEFTGEIKGYNSMPITVRAAAGGTVIFSGLLNIQSNGLTKDGAGTVKLTRANGGAQNATGGTTIKEGTLLVMNTANSGLGTGFVLVENGARLGGTGIINSGSNSFLVKSGATLLGGDGDSAAGHLTLLGNVTFEANSKIELVLGPGLASSNITRSSGTWTFDNDMTVVLKLLSGATVGTYENILAGLSANPIGSNWKIVDESGSTLTGSFLWDGVNVDLVLTAIPEPSTYVLLGMGLLTLTLGYMRHRRRLRTAS